MIRRVIIICSAVLLAAVVACPTVAANAAAKPSQFSCTGVKIEPASQAQSPMTVKLNLASARKVAIDAGSGDIKNSVTSDDQITLRFRTKDFIGEFFHYTNDLFLIYHSGHLAKLSCTPAQ